MANILAVAAEKAARSVLVSRRAEGAEPRGQPQPNGHRRPPQGRASARRLSDWARPEIPGRALEAERSWGLVTVADGRAAGGAGSPAAPLRGGRASFADPLSVIGSVRFPWGRGGAAGLGPPSGWAVGGGEILCLESSGAP